MVTVSNHMPPLVDVDQAAVEREREGLVDERYQHLSSALDNVNRELSEVYRFLTGERVHVFRCTPV